MKALLGKKIEMTQVFDENGNLVPVTVIDVATNVTIAKKTKDVDGYDAIVIGYGQSKKPSKAEIGQYKELGHVPAKVVEIRDGESLMDEEGKLEDLTGKKVTVTGRSKGKGFQGVVKRWGFAGGKKTHGQSDRMRAPGSIGSGTTPGRVHKGKKMGGRMGGDTISTENLRVVKYMADSDIILIKGAIPGANGSTIVIKVQE